MALGATRLMQSYSAKTHCLVLLTFLAVVIASPARAELLLGVTDDQAGFAEIRSEKSADAPVVATVKANEPFDFKCEEDAEWCSVTLTSGKSGWIEWRRIRLYYTDKDLPVRDKSSEGLSEIDEMARGRGLDYASVTRRAARGDTKALKQFFQLAENADGGAAESITSIPTIVFHLLGDVKFAKFLAAQPVPFRFMVRNHILGDARLPPAIPYLQRHFPETTKILFPREMVDWFSPDGHYAIRKVFSDELQLGGSKVVRAELIEKASGRVLCDLTADDIGTGAQREGEALWSPDSKRVACLSTDLTPQKGNLFSTPRPAPHKKQTAVYQLSGDSFVRVDLPLSDVPGRKDDRELDRAILGHEYTEPLRWKKPDVLLLQRHEYYETLKPIEGSELESIHAFDRLYEITATITRDGKASIAWKLRKNRP